VLYLQTVLPSLKWQTFFFGYPLNARNVMSYLGKIFPNLTQERRKHSYFRSFQTNQHPHIYFSIVCALIHDTQLNRFEQGSH
jgi:hypothetical protein